MNSEAIDLSNLIKIIRERVRLILVTVAASTLLFLLASAVLPKKYKSSATLTIYTKYFQNPLVKDFLPEIYDNTELKSQRETLIKKAFSSEFIIAVGEKNKLFKSEKNDPRRSLEEFDIFKRIEVYSVETTTFQISYVGRTPTETFDVMSAIVRRVTETLAFERRKTIAQLRDSIRKRIETMALNMDSAADPLASVRPELLQAELDRVSSQIKALRTQYTDRHPMVTRLVARAEMLKKWLATSTKPGATARDVGEAPLVGGEPKDPSLLVYSDLMKKLNYLNIVLEMEDGAESAYVSVLQAPVLPDSPIFPKRSLFLLWGLVTGLMLSMTLLLLKEYILRSSVTPEQIAKNIGVDYFGPLPAIKWQESSPPSNEKQGKQGASLDGWQ